MRTKFAALAVATSAALVASTATPALAYPNAVPFRPPVVFVVALAGTASVIADAIYISATQCREMTSQEAATATFLPGVGPIYNATQPSMSRCNK